MNLNIPGAAGRLRSLNGITFAYIIIRSLFKHIDNIPILLETSQIDLLILAETFLNNSIPDIYIQIDGYTFIRSDRDAGSSKHGGRGWLFITETIVVN